MQKEKLKQENIIKDLCQNESLRYDRAPYRLIPGVLLTMIAVLIAVFLNIWVGAVLGLFAFALLIWEGRYYLQYRKLLSSVRAGQFTVTSEVLTGCSKEDVRISGFTCWKKPQYVLHFGSEDYCVIQDNYPWSRDYRLGYDGMINTSIVGDEFWVVRPNETQEIGAVYNKKFFDFDNI